MTTDVGRRPLYGLVLTGGHSRRLGHDKALLARAGGTQLAYLTGLLQEFCGAVFVSVRADQREDPERRRYQQVVDRETSKGPLRGILSAMHAHSEVDWLVVACDLPNVDAVTLGQLIEARDGRYPFTAYRSSHDDLPEPLCAIYASDSRSILEENAASGVHCPRKIMIRSATQLLTQPTPVALHNVNTADDLRDSELEVTT